MFRLSAFIIVFATLGMLTGCIGTAVTYDEYWAKQREDALQHNYLEGMETVGRGLRGEFYTPNYVQIP